MSLDPKTLAQLSAYLDDALTLAEKSDVDVLLHRNPEARQALAALKAVRDSMKTLPPLAPPESFYDRVWRRIDAAPAEPPVRVFAPWKLAGALAAAALVVVATHDFWRSPAVRQRDFARMAEEAPSPIQLFQAPLGAEQAAKDMAPATDALRENEAAKVPLAAAVPEMKGEVRANQAPASPGAPMVPGQATPLENAGLALATPPTPSSSPRQESVQRAKALADLGAAARADASDESLLKKRADVRAVAADGQTRGAAPVVGAKESDLNAKADAPETGGVAAAAPPAAPVERAAPALAKAAADARAQEWRGSYSGVGEPLNVVVRSAAEWEALWARHAPGTAAPVVDFDRSCVAAVFAGQKPTGGHAVDVLRIETQAAQVVISYRVGAPAPGAMAIQAVTTPYHIRAFPRTDLPVKFEAN